MILLMKSFEPDATTTPEQKMERFHNALSRILKVSKDDLKAAEAEDERIRRLRKGKPGPKPSSTLDYVSDSES
jgi:hypothetical protein